MTTQSQSNSNTMNTTNTSSSLEDLTKSATSELSTMGRVSHRLAMTEGGEALQKVLHLLLPRLLSRIGSNHEKTTQLKKQQQQQQQQSEQVARVTDLYNQIHAKVVEMLSHIMKRVRADNQCKLPCEAVLGLMYDANTKTAYPPTALNPFTLNLSLTFLTIGIPRCSIPELTSTSLLPGLLALLGAHYSSDRPISALKSKSKINQAQQVSHLVLRAIGKIVNDDTSKSNTTQHKHSKHSSKHKHSSQLQLQIARQLCHENPSISAALYDLLLDVLCYQTQAPHTQIPPPGLSQSGKDRLLSGTPTSTLEKTNTNTWMAEYANVGRLRDLKLAVLDFISPCRRWDIFDVSGTSSFHLPSSSSSSLSSASSSLSSFSPTQETKRMKKNDNPDNHESTVNVNVNVKKHPRRNHDISYLGISRTVSLLVVASGDVHVDIVECATSYLKAHLDSLRTSSFSSTTTTNTTTTTNNTTTDTSQSNKRGSSTASSTSLLLGDPIVLTCQLLSFVLGDIVAENAISKVMSQFQTATSTSTLGVTLRKDISTNANVNKMNNDDRVAIMSTKRRMVSEKTATAIMQFISLRILEELPGIFVSHPSMNMNDNNIINGKDKDRHDEYEYEYEYWNHCGSSTASIGALVVLVVNKFVGSSGRSLSGISLTSSAGNPSVASARLLNSLCVRMVSVYNDVIVIVSDATATPNNNDDDDDNEVISKIQKSMHELLMKSLQIACKIISVASSSHSGDVDNTIGIETRDAAYGIICTLSRTQQLQPQSQPQPSVDTKESNSHHGSGSGSGGGGVGALVLDNAFAEEGGDFRSANIATLLFGCCSNETEALRPRAVAALDSILAAYCRLVHLHSMEQNEASNFQSTTNELQTQTAVDSSVEPINIYINPWATDTSTSTSTLTIDSEKIETKDPLNELSKSLLPLLWSAAQPNQPKASRYAAAKWANELLKPLDLINASHLLIFLTGDKDTTVSSIAKEGLQLASQMGQDEIISDHDNSLVTTGATATATAITIAQDGNEALLPDFHNYISSVFNKGQEQDMRRLLQRQFFWDFTLRGQAAAFRFGMMCLLNDLYGDTEEPLVRYLSVLSDVLNTFLISTSSAARRRDKESMDLLDECAICIAECFRTSSFARQKFVRSSLSLGLQDISKLALSVHSSKARRHLAAACGYLIEDVSIWNERSVQGVGIEQWLQNCKMDQMLEASCKKLSGTRSSSSSTDHSSMGEAHGAIFLGSRCVRALRLTLHRENHIMLTPLSKRCWEYASDILSCLGHGLTSEEEMIGNACSKGLVIALSYDGMDAPALNKHLHAGTTQALVQLSMGLGKYGNGDHMDATRASSLAEAAGTVLAASTVYEKIDNSTSDTPNNSVSVGVARLRCVDALFSLIGSSSSRKDPEISLMVGEALAYYADAYSPQGATWTTPTRTTSEEESAEFDISYANQLPPHSQIVYRILKKEIKVSNPIKRTSCAPVMLALVGRAARIANNDSSLLHRAFVQEIFQHLHHFQIAMLDLLADPKSKQLARESSCLGLAACQGLFLVGTAITNATIITESNEQLEMRKNELNERLLKAFGQTSNHGQSALMETRTQNAQRMHENRGEGQNNPIATMMNEFAGGEAPIEVGGAAGMGEAALGAYREMASAAVLLGRPDVLYSLMILSVNLPTWSLPRFRDRYSASALLGSSGTNDSVRNRNEMRRALRPHLAKLIPRMLRATHDPNRQTREQMNALWVGITGGGADSRALISQHFLITVDSLISDAMNKLWRARVGACGALSEIIVGRDWNELGGGGKLIDEDVNYSKGPQTAATRLLRLYKVTVRALDDYRSSVRESGEALARSVRSLTIRLCTPSSPDDQKLNPSRPNDKKARQNEKDAASAASTVLPWLVKYGLNQPCAEATGFSISCLLGVVEVSKPSTLQDALPDLIGALLMAMSGLEPAALNYLQVRASAQDSNISSDRLERLRLQQAQSGPIAGALTKCLDMMKFITLDSQKAIIPQIDSALRCGAGFATRAAAADAVSSICSICPLAFKFPGSSTTNPTVRLLRALYYASERERGNAARDKMTHAFGNLAALAPGSSVRSIALRLCDRYKNATGSNDDPAARKAAASAMRAIAVRASNQFSDGGSNDIWNRRVLPLAYIASNEQAGQKDGQIGSLWKEVWEEGGQAANLSVKTEDSFSVHLQEKLLPFISSSLIDALNDVSWKRRVMACKALTELAQMNILSPPPQSVGKTSMVSKEAQIRARRRAQASHKILNTCVSLMVKSRVWDGKVDLVKTICEIAANWVNYGFIDQENASNIFGWEKINSDSERCPYIPILHQPQLWNDLFLSDSWFEKSSEEPLGSDQENDAISSDSPVCASDEENGEVKDGILDFSEENKFMEDENQVDENEKECQELNISNDINSPPQLQLLTFSGLCRILLEQGICNSGKSRAIFYSYEALPYRAAALQSLSKLLDSLNVKKNVNLKDSSNVLYQQYLYEKIAPQLISMIEGSETMLQGKGLGEEGIVNLPPLIAARSIDCLASVMWSGMQATSDNHWSDVLLLTKLLSHNCGPSQAAWTVREAAALAAAKLSAKAHPISLQKIEVLETLTGCTVFCLKDRKFWRVRYAGLQIVHFLCRRVEKSNQKILRTNTADVSNVNLEGPHDHMMLDTLLPYKERFLDIAKSSLSDNEAKVTSAASDICNAVAWWP